MTKREIILIIALIAIGALTRTVVHVVPNLEFVTAISIVAGFNFHSSSKRLLALIVPLATMVITDAVIGNTSILLFTWSAYLIAPLFGIVLNKFNNKHRQYKIMASIGSAIVFTIIFYLWTNFGVVATTNMYPHNLAGLMESYLMALPFLWNQLVGNIIFTPILLLLSKWLMATELHDGSIEQKLLIAHS
jgi:hypothetical protein